MTGRAKYDFPQEAPDRPFNTVPFAELVHALFAKQLHNRIPRDPPRTKVRVAWGSKRFVWARKFRHPLIQRAGQRSEVQILADLRAGQLAAHAPTDAPGIFRRIPPNYWNEKFSGLSLAGVLLDVTNGGVVPKELLGSTIYVFEKCARVWLMQREINEDNPAFPPSLRKRPSAKPVPKPFKEVQAKMLALMAAGYSRNEAAKHIGKLPGFAGVRNGVARDAVRGLVKPGPRSKNNAER